MEHQTKATRVATEIRRRIESGEIEPGTLLRQRDLAAELNVSPTPVREALSRLEAEGFVMNEPHRGATVIRTEVSRLWENALIRAALESLGARLAVDRLHDEALDGLRDLADEFSECTGNAEKASQLNRQFHFRIYEAARSPVLMRLLNILWGALPRGPERYRDHEESAQQHAQILQALIDGDADAAETLTREHILGSASRLWDSSGAGSQQRRPYGQGADDSVPSATRSSG